MGFNAGKNGGIGGTLISLLTDGSGTALAFNVQVLAFNGKQMFRVINRRGRGSAGAPKVRLADLAGGGTFSGKLPLTGWPCPSNQKYATGTIEFAMHRQDNGTLIDGVSFPVVIQDMAFTRDEKMTDMWAVTGTWAAAGLPTWTWQGNRISLSAPAANDQELYGEGLTKTYDSRGILTGATQRIDCEGVTDTDAAEVSKLVALIAAAATPVANLKIKTISCTKQEDDSTGLTVTITWALQDSKDEIETPRNTINTDPFDLESSQTVAIVYTTGTPPTDPTVPTGLKLRKKTDQKINDQLSFRLYEWAKNTTKDDLLLPKTTNNFDELHLKSSATVATLDDTTTPSNPMSTEVVLTGHADTKVTSDHTLRVWKFGDKTSWDEIQFPGTKTILDPADLTTNGEITTVFMVANGVPSDPAPPTHTKIIGSWQIQLTNSGGSNVAYKVWRFEPQTSKDKIEQDGSTTRDDPNLLDSGATWTNVDADPATPSGTVRRWVTTKNLSDWHYQRTAEYGQRTTIDDVVFPQSKVDVDPASNFTTRGVAGAVHTTGSIPSTPTPPTNTIAIGHYTLPLTNSAASNLSNTVWAYGQRTSVDDVVFPQNRVDVDPSLNLETRGTAGAVFTTGSTPSDPTPPTGTKIVGSWTVVLTNASASNLSNKVWNFAPQTSRDRIEQGGTVQIIDPSGLDSGGTVTVVDGTPAAPSGYAEIVTETQQLSDFHTKKTIKYGLQSTIQSLLSKSSSATCSAFNPYTSIVPVVIDVAAGTLPATTAAADWNTIIGNDNAVGVRVVQLNPTKHLSIREFVNSGKMLIGNTGGPTRRMAAKLDGSDIKMWMTISRKRTLGGTSAYECTHNSFITTVPLRKFLLGRTIKGTTIPDQNSICGYTNSDTFLGLPPGTVKYLGARYLAPHFDLSSTRTFMMYYGFESDANGIFDFLGPTDKMQTFSGTLTPGTAWVKVSDFGGSIWSASAPSTTSFTTAFLS